jgi:hypothetical protein
MEILNRYELRFRDADESGKQALIGRLESLISPDFLTQLLLLSFLFHVTEDRAYAKRLLRLITESRIPAVPARYLYWQLLRIAFIHTDIFTMEEQIRLAKFYVRVVKGWREQLGIHRSWIPPTQRNRTRVVLTTSVLLGAGHAPTDQILEIGRTLQRDLGKEVVLINTAEAPRFLRLPFYDTFLANFHEPYSAWQRFQYEEEFFTFRQFVGMESEAELAEFLAMITNWSPGFVLNIGAHSMVSDLCATFTTVAALPMAYCLPISAGNLLLVPGGVSEIDRELQRTLGIPDERVASVGFAYELPKRSQTLRRSGCGIPKDAYAIAIVSNRLDQEITAEFVSELTSLLHNVPQAFLVFAGEWHGYEKLTKDNAVFRERSLTMGYQKDLVALYEICDSYLNPPRVGGGTSAAWALAVGLPVYTLPKGDVAAVAGKAFHFSTIEGIQADVRRSIVDPPYRQSRSSLARNRFDRFSNRKNVTADILRQIEDRLDLRI